MGLLDQLAGQVLGKMLSDGGADKLVQSVFSMLGNNQQGGLGGLVAKLNQSGLGDVVASWISTGQNQPVSPTQLQAALGDEQVASIAKETGLSTEQTAGGLAELLPQIIDKLTPDGNLPGNNDLLAQAMNVLKGTLLGGRSSSV
jgi:uncharacterized protein YidB (DUF937 family)